MQPPDEQPYPEQMRAIPTGEPLALPFAEPRMGLAVASYGPRKYRLASASVITGVLSSAVGVFFLASLFKPNAFHVLFLGDGMVFSIMYGGIWLCLAVLAPIFSIQALIRLPKGRAAGKEVLLASLGLSLGITNLLVLLAGFALLLVALLMPAPPGGYDQVGIWL
jgi:hypothetical protein